MEILKYDRDSVKMPKVQILKMLKRMVSGLNTEGFAALTCAATVDVPLYRADMICYLNDILRLEELREQMGAEAFED